MSTHNIGFYEDLTKIIFELSSNIIKYAPYFFCCFARFSVKIYIADLPDLCNILMRTCNIYFMENLQNRFSIIIIYTPNLLV